jgi:hypothetical protein
MTWHHAFPVHRQVTVGHVQVCTAHPTGLDLDQNVPRAGYRDGPLCLPDPGPPSGVAGDLPGQHPGATDGS